LPFKYAALRCHPITVLSMMWSGIISSPVFVGCSGGVSAFLGSEVGGNLRDRS